MTEGSPSHRSSPLPPETQGIGEGEGEATPLSAQACRRCRKKKVSSILVDLYGWQV
jgi:hypothetical protein